MTTFGKVESPIWVKRIFCHEGPLTRFGDTQITKVNRRREWLLRRNRSISGLGRERLQPRHSGHRTETRDRLLRVDRGRTTTRMIDAVGPRTLPKQIPQRPQDRPYLPPVGDCRLRVPPRASACAQPRRQRSTASHRSGWPTAPGCSARCCRPGRARGTRRGRIYLMHEREQSRSRSARDSSRNRARCPPLKPRLAARALPSDFGRACRRRAHPGRRDQGWNHVFACAYRHDPFTPQAHPSRQQPLAVDASRLCGDYAV
jgi:hypothetical protein